MEQKIRMYPIGQLRKQLSVMEKKKMSPKRIVNMLKLLTGCDVQSMLAGPGLYPAENFYQMAKMLGYRHTYEFVQDILISELFYVAIENGNCPKVRWFASPVFLLESDIEDAKKYKGMSTLFSENSIPQNAPQNALQNALQISGHIQTTSSH